MRIGLAQIDIYWEQKEENKKKCSQMIQEAKEKGVDFIVFPEMTLTGFSMNTELIAESQENSDTISYFRKEAVKNQISVGFGVVIKGEKKAENKFIIMDCSGTILTDYSKIHPFSFGEENEHYIKGEQVVNCQLNDFTISPLICYDLRFPEIFQVCSRKSNLIVVIANWPTIRRGHWITLLKARAVENQCFIAGVNRFGDGNGVDYSGDSIVVNPYGEIITHCLPSEGLIVTDINVKLAEEYRKEFRLKDDRREELYIRFYREEI